MLKNIYKNNKKLNFKLFITFLQEEMFYFVILHYKISKYDTGN